MKKPLLVAALAASVAFAGCETNQDTGTVVGGIVGNEIGRSLDARDRQLARQAEYDAWEHGEPGRPVRWRNAENDRYGEVIPETRYRRGPRDCRDFVHKIYIDGRPQQMRGTACRNPDGTWTQVG